MLLSFSKYQGAGNDFILIDNREDFFPTDDKNFISRLCHRHFGIGADGLVLLQNSILADFGMRVFNLDGHEAEMCGNGLRCLGKFLKDLGFTERTYTIETQKRTLSLSYSKGQISTEMGPVTEIQWNLEFPSLHLPFPIKGIHKLDTGVPHVVLLVEGLEKIDVQTAGAQIRHHSLFRPSGSNVTFASVDPVKKEVKIRTFERGVEKETFSCGTGAAAAAIAASKAFALPPPIKVIPRSKEVMTLSFKGPSECPSQVTVSGPAHRIYQGILDPKELPGLKRFSLLNESLSIR